MLEAQFYRKDNKEEGRAATALAALIELVDEFYKDHQQMHLVGGYQ